MSCVSYLGCCEVWRYRRVLCLQMDSPLKKVAVSGKLDTNKPYSLRLQNVFDDRDVMTSSLEVNPDTGRFQFSSDYDRGEWSRLAPSHRQGTWAPPAAMAAICV